jgi:hypothetical protein
MTIEKHSFNVLNYHVSSGEINFNVMSGFSLGGPDWSRYTGYVSLITKGVDRPQYILGGYAPTSIPPP